MTTYLKRKVEFKALVFPFNSSPSTLDDVIMHLQLHLKPEVYEIQVCRHDLLKGHLKETTRATFDPMKRVKVE